MNKSSGVNNGSTEALRKLEAQGLAFTNDAFLSEIIGRDLEKVALFIKAGIDVNMPVDGTPPIVLLASSRRGNCGIARLLIDNGVDVNAVNEDGVTAIRMAIFNGHQDLVQLLIENGADVCAADQDGVTAIQAAAMHNRTEIVRLLIENGADVNAAGKGGLTAMQIALSDNRKELMRVLVENGAEPTAQTAPEHLMSEKLEITHIIERLELLEEKFGIAISGLYASCYYRSNGTPPYHQVIINFDVTSLNGEQLERSLKINASAYNSAGQLLDTSSAYINNEEFIGFGPMSILAHLDQAPERIRLFPAAYD